MTVNELMTIMKIARERVNDLKDLRLKVSTRERFYGTVERTVEPEYDVKIVDKKITSLQNFIVIADMKIKNSNAITTVDIDVGVDNLLEPLQ